MIKKISARAAVPVSFIRMVLAQEKSSPKSGGNPLVFQDFVVALADVISLFPS